MIVLERHRKYVTVSTLDNSGQTIAEESVVIDVYTTRYPDGTVGVLLPLPLSAIHLSAN